MDLLVRLPKELQLYVFEFGAKPDLDNRNRLIREIQQNHSRVRADIIRIHNVYGMLELTSVEDYIAIQEIIDTLWLCHCCTRHMHEERLGPHSTVPCSCPCRHMRRWINNLL
jgi:hypothetical protein